MKHWIDRTAESDNVIGANENGLLIASCEKSRHEYAESQLILGVPIAEVLGNDTARVVPFSQIQSVTARDTDCHVDVHYIKKGETVHESLVFEDLLAVRSFVQNLDAVLPVALSRESGQPSRCAAALVPALSLALSIGASALLIDKVRLPVYLVGGAWATASLWFLLRSLKSSAAITRWSLDAQTSRHEPSALMSGIAFAVVTLVVVGTSIVLPDRYGERAVYEAILDTGVTGADVRKAYARGGDLDLIDGSGDTPLALAVRKGASDAAIALIEAGADLSAGNTKQSALEMVLESNADARVIDAIVSRGGLNHARLNGFDPYAHVERHGSDYDDAQLDALFGARMGAANP